MNLILLRYKIEKSWSAASAYEPALFNTNKAAFQCEVTSRLIYEVIVASSEPYSNKIFKGIIEGREHWFNVINNVPFDITFRQFAPASVLESIIEVKPETLCVEDWKVKCYNELKTNYNSQE